MLTCLRWLALWHSAGGLPGPPRAITQATIQMGMEQGFKQFNLGIPL